MTAPAGDKRSSVRRDRDEQIAAEPRLEPLNLPSDAASSPVESHLQPRRPLAVVGVVENGLVRPLDSAVRLVEHSRVIIVTSEGE
jgi:hypothetical protein